MKQIIKFISLPIIKYSLFFLLVCLSVLTFAKQQLFISSIHRITIQDIYQQKSVPVYRYKVLKTYPHATDAFTQGFIFDDDYLYESTGLYGFSSLRKVDLDTGKTLQMYKLPNHYFAEGLTIIGNSMYQLTYKEKIGFVYDKSNFHLLRTFNYPTEGWGLTHDQQDLILSDGSATLYFINSNTLKIDHTVDVHEGKINVAYLNELEYINGIIYANIWQTDIIAMINPNTGAIVGWIDLSGIYPVHPMYQNSNVLNGIAYNTATKQLLVTGKMWPSIFEIQVTNFQS